MCQENILIDTDRELLLKGGTHYHHARKWDAVKAQEQLEASQVKMLIWVLRCGCSDTLSVK